MNLRASAQLSDYVSGRTAPEQATPAIKSWSEFWCYHKAIEIHLQLFEPDKKRIYESVPRHLQDWVKYYMYVTINKRR